jgi:hypothetical protein
MAGHDVGEHAMLDIVHPDDINDNNMATNTDITMTGSISPTEKTARSSFSSVRENDDGLAQTFTRSKFSSYTNAPEDVDVFDESPSLEISQPSFQPPLTQPNSRLHGFWFPADSFRGWREIPLKGKKASRSVENLRSLYMSWSPPDTPVVEKKQVASYGIGQSPLETLPSEILGTNLFNSGPFGTARQTSSNKLQLGSIIDLLVVELPPTGLTTRNADLSALLLASRSLHAATLNTLYRHITIPHSRIFRKFLATITKYPTLASMVRRLDFSHFNPATIFSTASERAQTRNLTAETLAQCLELTPFLQEFLAQEYVDDDLSPDVLRKLLFGMPRLQALDFCACSSASFRNSFREILEDEWPEQLSISRLSLHKCMSLPSAAFDMMLPRLGKVTHLDLAGTRVTDDALLSIPATARITHLNLAKCKELTSQGVVKFITAHPAVKDSLTFLSLAMDASSHLLLGKEDIDALLPCLPQTLRSLSLKGSRMDRSHISQLASLAEGLEELSLGRGLELGDIHRLFTNDGEWHQHHLRYLDISDVEYKIGSASDLLKPASAPLHVIEIEERAYERAAKARKTLERVGWTAKEFGSRYWLVRLNADGTTQDDGSRWWKLGAESWGMRKIPVATAEVGGMYGSFMFGRRL